MGDDTATQRVAAPTSVGTAYGFYRFILVGLILLKFGEFGTPATWSWWFIVGLWAIPWILAGLVTAIAAALVSKQSK